tara:strand:- start:2227 stop:2868 length:642 start_codon:yes stop_codon:yes gene_type:complete
MMKATVFLMAIGSASGLQVGPMMSQRVVSTRLGSVPAVSMAAKYTDASGAEIKSALSPYMHFCQERRVGLTAELKAKMGASFANTEVMKSLGAEWKLLDAGTVERFKGVAVQDKARFDAAVASNPANAEVKPTKRSKKAKADGKPRPLSSYMHFCADRRTSLTAELKSEMGAAFENKMVMVKLGAEWKELGDGAKAKYVAMAEKQKAELAAAA